MKRKVNFYVKFSLLFQLKAGWCVAAYLVNYLVEIGMSHWHDEKNVSIHIEIYIYFSAAMHYAHKIPMGF